MNPTDIDSDTTKASDVEDDEGRSRKLTRKIRIVDRFGIILQIFASRAKTRAA